MAFQNVVVGEPLVHPKELIALNDGDWEINEKQQTLFTLERFLPKIMVEAGFVKSINEVRRNQPKLVRTLDTLDCINIKWGKHFLYIVVGE